MENNSAGEKVKKERKDKILFKNYNSTMKENEANNSIKFIIKDSKAFK